MLIKVRTLTGKEIELDIEPDYRVRNLLEGSSGSMLTYSSTGLADQGEGRGEGRHPTGPTTFDLWWKADVSL